MQLYKYFILILFIAPFLWQCNFNALDVDPLAGINHCRGSEAGANYYAQTAEWIAIQKVFKEDSAYQSYQDSLYFPIKLIKDIEHKLAVIYDAVDIPERDTIIDLLAISMNLRESYKTILLNVDPEEAWLKHLIEGTFPTGNTTFDQLYSEFEYEVDSKLAGNTLLVLKSKNDKLFNVGEVIRRIKASPLSTGIKIISGGNNLIASPADIRLSVTEANDYYFTFRYGWGDCPRGCQNYRYWEFRVSDDCETQFVSAYGNVLPD